MEGGDLGRQGAFASTQGTWQVGKTRIFRIVKTAQPLHGDHICTLHRWKPQFENGWAGGEVTRERDGFPGACCTS